ncbi:hypothetical protein VTK73DRAFT_8733 [Phialemonium thermophilum]|uniref:Uncharacterized protein n=1 Tax=Phialemonium thermophilum TaxID=223376 RepID=A0ABR3W731_9PEZI
MESDGPASTRVAVIGIGAVGLVTLKNLLEEGYDAFGFDRNDYIGGLWHFTPEDKTSVLPSTVANVSKERNCFTDFPFPEETPSLCPASEVEKYLEQYADHFNLRPRIRLGTLVTRVWRDDAREKWVLNIQGSTSQVFDKVVFATGTYHKPNIPAIPAIETYTGVSLHSRAYKDPKPFEGKNVLIVGFGNTGADTAVSLVGVANKVYISHREGTLIFPRLRNGCPVDHSLTARMTAVQGLFQRHFPGIAEALLNNFGKKLQDEAFNIRPEWGLSPAPSLKFGIPVVSDEIVAALEAGTVESVPGVRAAVAPRAFELQDGRRLDEIDAVIYCTGYCADFGLLEPRFDPTRDTTPAWAAAPGSRGKPLPRLYRNIFSLDHPYSLVYVGGVFTPLPAFPLFDVTSMALVQVWRGRSPLPPRDEMIASVDRHHAWMVENAKIAKVTPNLVDRREWSAWVDEAAGMGIQERLGWGWRGWAFWLSDPKLCSLLMTGLSSPHQYRLFDCGKRKAWRGARAEIERVNRAVKEKPKTA